MTDINQPKETDKSRTLNVIRQTDKSDDTTMAEIALSGIMNSASLIVGFSKNNFGEISLTECVGVLSKKAASIRKGNLGDAEDVLIAQALALDSIFASLARRAQLNMGEYIDAADRYMRLALKAQGQCRATLETLAAIKNPPVVFAKQANIANGPQQVNNTLNKSDGGFYSNTHARAHAHAGNSDSVQNELLENKHEQGMDIRTTGTTGRGDPAMATMDAIHRPTHK